MTVRNDLLLEVGSEEIPARFLPQAIEQLKDKASKLFGDLRLDLAELRAYATPRRLVLYVRDLAERQSELNAEVRGPAKKITFDAQGHPTKAGEGFARGQGVPVAGLLTREVDGVEYVFAKKHEDGRSVMEVLPQALSDLILSLEFPKTMRWGEGVWKFARPVHWIVCLFGSEVVPVRLFDLAAGRVSRGHRTLAKGPVEIARPQEYFLKMENDGFVMVDQEHRQSAVVEQLKKLESQLGAVVPVDPDLLEEVTFILEYPTAFFGSFEEQYLKVPQEVLITSMREHQRYFPVEDVSGKLRNHFIAVRNGTADGIDVIRQGNEKVLRARLADAKFFYEEDQKRHLSDRVEALSGVVFLEKLGTMRQKVERIQELVEFLISELGVEGQEVSDARRAALLCKSDLVTAMVREFTELQGVMGREYGRLSGETPGTAQAIFEHYLPRFAGDNYPSTIPGALVALADKIDTIAGCFAIGLIPTGSQDPYALRRGAQGITGLLASGVLPPERPLSIGRLTGKALSIYAAAGLTGASGEAAAKVRAQIQEFFGARIKNLLGDRGYRYDLVDAVIEAGADQAGDAARRAEALDRLIRGGDLEPVLAAFKRVNNLAQKAEPGPFDPSQLREPAEVELYKAYITVNGPARSAAAAGNYDDYFAAISGLRPPVDQFLDKVLVMAPEEGLRRARLGLLRELASLFRLAADLTKLVGP